MNNADAPRLKAVFFVALLASALSFLSPASPSASTMAVETDGKIVLAGSASQWTPYCITPARLHRCFLHRVLKPAVVRLDADGHPDPDFGAGGGIIDFRSRGFSSVAVLPERGIRLGSGSGSRFQVTALDSSGYPDFGFGRSGLAASPPTTADAADLATILPRPDGSLVVGGNLVTFAPKTVEASSSVAVAMDFNASGLPGQRLGEVSTETEGSTVGLADLVSQGDAFVAVGGLTGFESTSGFLARFSGSVLPYDPSFGGGSGLVQFGPFPRPEGEVAFRSVAADERGLIAVGYKGSRILLARYHVDGTLDTGFGEGGLAGPPVPLAGSRSPQATAVVTQPDGKLVVGGIVSLSPRTLCGARTDICWLPFLARFQPDGQLDQGFGAAGFSFGSPRSTSTGPNGSSFGLVLQPDGKILFSHAAVGGSSLGVARYNADGNLDTSFGQSGEAGVLPCQGSVVQRRRSGCLSTAAVSLKAHGLSAGRPASQFSLRVSNPLDPVAAVKLLLPAEIEGRKGTAGKARVVTVPRAHARIRVRPGVVTVSRLANARGLHVAVGPGVLQRVAPVATTQKLPFRVEVEFKDGTSELFGFRSPG